MFLGLGRVLGRRKEPNLNARVPKSSKSKKMASVAKVIEIDGRNLIWSVVFTADGKHVLAGGAESKVRCWGIDDGKEVTTRKQMDVENAVYSIAVSQDGKWVVSGADGRTACVFDAKTGEVSTVLEGHTAAVGAVDVSMDGTRIATGSDDCTACLWSLSTGDQLQKLQHDSSLAAVKFSPDGQMLATATPWSVQIFERDSGRWHYRFDIQVSFLRNQSIAWHHNNKHLFAASIDGYIHHLDVLTGNMPSKWRIHNNEPPRCIALASDSAYIAASAGQCISFWNTMTHQEVGSPICDTDTIRSMAISMADHDIATSVDMTVTVRNLRDVLPAPYCDNTTRNLQADLTDLQRRYKAQLHKLRRVIALKAELDHRKRTVAIKSYKLSALRQQLEQLPDLSHELVIVRNEVRQSETQAHDIHHQYNDHLGDISLIVADSQPKSPIIHQTIANSDSSAEKAIVRTLEELNAAIQRTSVTVSAYFIHHFDSPSTEAQAGAAQRASDAIHQSLVHRLLNLPRLNLPLYLPIAIQAYLATYFYRVISSWTNDKGANELIGEMYERACKSESHTFAVGWRSLTATSISASAENVDDIVAQAVRGLSDIVVAAGCFASTSDAQAKMLPKFWNDISTMISAAKRLGELTWARPVADFQIIIVHPGQMFDDRTMAINHQVDLGMPARGRILCTTRLGLTKQVIREPRHPGQSNALAAPITTMVKAAVVRQG